MTGGGVNVLVRVVRVIRRRDKFGKLSRRKEGGRGPD